MRNHRSTAIVVAGAACELRIGDEKIRDSFSGDDQADSMAYALGLRLGCFPEWPGARAMSRVRYVAAMRGRTVEIQPCALVHLEPARSCAWLIPLDDSRAWCWHDVSGDRRC